MLEIGSAGAEPFIRGLFDTSDYTGIDLVNGPNVDVVADAKTYKHDLAYDVVVCVSVLEHDPGWKQILKNIRELTHDRSIVIGCHGAEGNLHHGPEPWAIVKEDDFLEACDELGYEVREAFFEEKLYGPDCAGAYDWILYRR